MELTTLDKELKKELLKIYYNFRLMNNIKIEEKDLLLLIETNLHYLQVLKITPEELIESSKEIALRKNLYGRLPSASDFAEFISKFRQKEQGGSPETRGQMAVKRIADIVEKHPSNIWHKIFFADPITQACVHISSFKTINKMSDALEGKGGGGEIVWRRDLVKELERSWGQCYELRKNKDIIDLGNKMIVIKKPNPERQNHVILDAVAGERERKFKIEVIPAEQEEIGFLDNISNESEVARHRYLKYISSQQDKIEDFTTKKQILTNQ